MFKTFAQVTGFTFAVALTTILSAIALYVFASCTEQAAQSNDVALTVFSLFCSLIFPLVPWGILYAVLIEYQR